MGVRRSAAPLFAVIAFLAACGGGGSGSSAIVPAPTPTPAPQVNASPGTRPTGAGSTFAFAGTRMQTVSYTYPASSPNPTRTDAVAITQNDVILPTSDPQGRQAIDLHSVQSGESAYETLTTTTDTEIAEDAAVTPHLYEILRSTSVDDQGNVFASTYDSPWIVDELPEAQDQRWNNSPAALVTEKDVDGNEFSRTINSDGTYSEHDRLFGANGADYYPTTDASYAVNADGSAQWTIQYDYEGRNLPLKSSVYIYTFTTPHDGRIELWFQGYDVPVSPAPSPTPVPAPQLIGNAPAWFTGALYRESNVDEGPAQLPADCSVPAAFGPYAYKLVEARHVVDPIVGVLENTITTQYVAAGFGVVCEKIAQSDEEFYDIQSDYFDKSFAGAPFAYATSASAPLSTTSTNQTLTLEQSGTTIAQRRYRKARSSSASLDVRAMTPRADVIGLMKRFRKLERRIHTLYRYSMRANGGAKR